MISAADRLRAFIKERRPQIGDAPPALPGSEWRLAGDGGWNLWESLPDEGPVKRWQYFDQLTEAEWEAIKNQHGAEVEGEQTIGSIPLTSEQAGEQLAGFRPDAGWRYHPGFRVIPRGSPGNMGADPPHSWPVVSNLALVPALTGEQIAARAGDLDAQRQPERTQVNSLLTSEQKNGSTAGGEVPGTSEQAETDWLKCLLPKLADGATGWWDVEARGKGFGVKFRWRSGGQHTLTFARVSRASFRRLQKMQDQKVLIGGQSYGKAAWYLRDWIGGQLADLQRDRDRERGDKARQVAARLRLESRNN